jgi:hypothetical protein
MRVVLLIMPATWLGLGRAPGTDQQTVRALRRPILGVGSFRQDILEIQSYFSDDPGNREI